MMQFFTTDVKMKFYLRKPYATLPTEIAMLVSFNGKKTRIMCKGVRVLPSLWSARHQRAFVSNILSDLDNHNNTIVNSIISNYENKFNEFLDFISANPKFAVTLHLELKKHFNMGRKPIHKQLKVDIFEEMRRLCRDNIKNVDVFKNYTEKGIPLLQKYIEAKSIEITDYHQFTSDLFWDMALWIDKCYRPNGKPYTVSTANTNVKYAISAVKKAAECGGFLTMAERATICQKELPNHSGKFNDIFLRNAEILKLWRYKCTSKRDEVVRDIFLLECLTGQRISDTKRISDNLETHNNTTYLELQTVKTQTNISVDIVFKLALEILIDKYKGEIPHENKDYINKRIKVIAENAGIIDEHKKYIHYCGEDKATESKHRRCDIISTHTGRRTFISQLVLRDWSYEKIAKYSGHEKIDTVSTYDKTNQKERDIYRRESEHIELLEHHQATPPQQQIAPITIPQPQLKDGDPTDIGEAIAVLNMLGADIDDYIGITDYKTLLQQVSKYENRIKAKFGGGRYEFKPIFNNSALPSERRTAMKELLKALEQQKED